MSRTARRGHDAPRETPALEVAEEALVLLKRLDASAWVPYVAGTCLFLWTLLWFWAYMSRNAHAGGRLGEFSLLLALAYLIMKVCHAHFFSRLMDAFQDKDSTRRHPGDIAYTALLQACLQPISLVAIPLSVLLTIPYPFVASFFQCAQWVRPGEPAGAWFSRSSEMARLWPMQNAWLHLFLAAAWVCVAGNLFTAIAVGPALLKSLLGMETIFTRTDAAILNSSILAMTAATAWAVVDPLKKAIHAWRTFHGISRRTGLDLDLALARCRTVKAAPAALALCLCLVLSAPASATPKSLPGISDRGGETPSATSALPTAPNPQPAGLDPDRLDALLRAEIAESRYGWRLPRGRSEAAGHSWMWLQLRNLLDQVEAGFKSLEAWGERIGAWFRRLFTGGSGNQHGKAGSSGSARTLRILMLSLAAVFAGGLIIFLIRRSLRPSSQASTAAPLPIAAAPDASREDAKADDFPEAEWLALMESLRARGEDRLALRALFLGTLSLLARKGWLTVARHKGNLDYQREVLARARRRQGVAEAFSENCRRFDRVWYGRHAVTLEDWQVSRGNFETVSAHEA